MCAKPSCGEESEEKEEKEEKEEEEDNKGGGRGRKKKGQVSFTPRNRHGVIRPTSENSNATRERERE